MKKIIIFLLLVVVIALGIGFLARDTQAPVNGPDLSAEVSNVTVQGVVTDVNLEQAMVDGPYLVVVAEEDGSEAIIAVPSMAIDMCVAKDNITHPSDIKKGMTVEASGALASDGNIVPCESPSHYLRVVTE